MELSPAELVGGKLFNVPFTGSAPVKPATEYKLVGTPVARRDMPAKVSGKHVYMQHVRVPGMMHARVVRPRGQGAYGEGAKVLNIDESSIRSIAGARLVRRGDFIGIVAENEWDAVRAAQQLKVTWDLKPTLPGNDRLYDQMRAAETQDRVVLEKGDVAGAIGKAAHIVSLTGRGPYQAHALFGPSCAIADVKTDSALIACTTSDVYSTRTNLARLLEIPVEKVQVQYYEGAGTYGHSCYEDAAQAAAGLLRTNTTAGSTIGLSSKLPRSSLSERRLQSGMEEQPSRSAR